MSGSHLRYVRYAPFNWWFSAGIIADSIFHTITYLFFFFANYSCIGDVRINIALTVLWSGLNNFLYAEYSSIVKQWEIIKNSYNGAFLILIGGFVSSKSCAIKNIIKIILQILIC